MAFVSIILKDILLVRLSLFNFLVYFSISQLVTLVPGHNYLQAGLLGEVRASTKHYLHADKDSTHHTRQNNNHQIVTWQELEAL